MFMQIVTIYTLLCNGLILPWLSPPLCAINIALVLVLNMRPVDPPTLMISIVLTASALVCSMKINPSDTTFVRVGVTILATAMIARLINEDLWFSRTLYGVPSMITPLIFGCASMIVIKHYDFRAGITHAGFVCLLVSPLPPHDIYSVITYLTATLITCYKGHRIISVPFAIIGVTLGILAMAYTTEKNFVALVTYVYFLQILWSVPRAPEKIVDNARIASRWSTALTPSIKM